MEKFYCKNVDETSAFAKSFAKTLNNGDMVFLYGDLGAGKTTLTKSILENFGIKENITSPTFTLLNLYSTNNATFCHFDLYRLEDASELEQLGFEEYFYAPNAICLIEWPQIIENYIDRPHKIIVIKKIDENAREIIVGDNNEDIVH